MKVLHVIQGLHIGGAETLIKDYCVILKELGIDVSVLCEQRYGTFYETYLEKKGIKVYYVSDYVHTKRKFGKIFGMINRYQIFSKIIKNIKPDIVHSHLLINKNILYSRMQNKFKLFHTIHSEPSKLWNNTISRKLDLYATKILVKFFDMKLICLHDDMKKNIQHMFHTQNVYLLNNGINIWKFQKKDDLKRIRRKLNIGEDSCVVGHIGRFAKVKNHKFLVEIFKELIKINPNIFLLLVGDGETKNEIEQLLLQSNLEGHYKILSNRSDIPELLNIIDVFVMPSLYEGIPISLIEAQVAKKRCVISDRINQSVIISNLVYSMSLQDSAVKWAQVINSFHVKEIEYYNLKSWDINTIVQELIQYYKN